MATEPLSEQITVRLAQLYAAQIDPQLDSEYWYKPDVVCRVDEISNGLLQNAADYTQVLLLAPGDARELERTSGTVTEVLDLFVCCARQYKPEIIDPLHPSADLKWTIQNRMVRDVIRCTLANVQVSDADGTPLAFNCAPVEVRRDFAVPDGWAVAVIRFAVEYEYPKDLP